MTFIAPEHKLAAEKEVFLSFHQDQDHCRADQILRMGILQGTPGISPDAWESLRQDGDVATRHWINGQLSGRACTVVLIGYRTAGLKWIRYTIRKSWMDGRGVVGIHVHNLLDHEGRTSPRGANPFEGMFVGGVPLGSVVRTYDPPFGLCTNVADYIHQNLSHWVDEAIAVRGRYSDLGMSPRPSAG